MSVLLLAFLVTAILSIVAAVFALRRVHDELGPTIRAFEHFRSALEPAVAGLRSDANATRRRLAGPGRDADRQ